jgi:hypothetical protein
MTTSEISFFLQLLAAASAVITPAALWWLSKHFAPKAAFDQLVLDVRDIRDTQIRLSNQEDRLDDHESRLRALEHERIHD